MATARNQYSELQETDRESWEAFFSPVLDDIIILDRESTAEIEFMIKMVSLPIQPLKMYLNVHRTTEGTSLTGR